MLWISRKMQPKPRLNRGSACWRTEWRSSLLRSYAESASPGATRRRIGWLSGLLPALAIAGQCHAQSVLGYHGSPDRSGNFIVPALTWEHARSLHLDAGFHPSFAGHLYSQPLYWQPPGSVAGMLIVATEDS